MKPLVVENISKNFEGIQALSDISLHIEEGERRALIGPNGAGKTTLFQIITGYLPPSGGKVFLFDKDVTALLPHKRVALGLGRTFQITNLFFPLTVLENVRLGLQGVSTVKFNLIRPINSYKHLLVKVQKLLEQWNLWDKRDVPVKDLSYGEQREIELIIALSQEPKLLLLDEPTAGLSTPEISLMSSLIKELPSDITILFIEHDMDVAFNLSERITVLNYGRVLSNGYKDEVKNDPLVQECYLGCELV